MTNEAHVDTSTFEHRAWAQLAEIAEFIRLGKPDEALSRARALKSSLKEAIVLSARFDTPTVRALLSRCRVDLRRALEAFNAQRTEIAARGAAQRSRERARYGSAAA